MTSAFNLSHIYDKNLNIFIGSGASYGLFPTLALKVRDQNENPMTVETLATHLGLNKENAEYTALFMHYYRECIEPVLTVDYTTVSEQDICKKEVLENYITFVKTILAILARKKSGDKRTCNVFTTNYDGCLAYAAEEILRTGTSEFYVNDGALGFKRRYLDAKNFNTQLTQTGIFGKHRNDLPQINLIHLHGSSCWYKDGQRIQVDYTKGNQERIVNGDAFENILDYSQALLNSEMEIGVLPKVQLSPAQIINFWNKYDALPIVNPTKWKFYETVFEEHYYQMLRYLSYELEKENSVLLTFGFSFADEHIRNLVKRSISNPSLQVFICCFDENSRNSLHSEFSMFPNVQMITVEGLLNFSIFNDKIFTLSPSPLSIHETQKLKVVA